MGTRITRATRDELLETLRTRYQESDRTAKSRILDEFVAVSGYHRKHAIRLLSQAEGGSPEKRNVRRVYDEAVRQALVILWEAADRICGKRLKALLPALVESMERHGHLSLDGQVRERLLAVSPATIDRLLAPTRSQIRGKKRRSRLPNSSVRRSVPVRTFADWDDPPPGYFEGDFVAHCGGSMAGSFLHTMTLTDIASGWTEGVALIARQQELVTEALDVFRSRLPMVLLGLDTDNDGALINETVVDYCKKHGIVFTRSRPHRSNDQAWVEQKNGAVVRRLIGYGRLEGLVAARVLTRLLMVARQYVNFFQPSFKLREKTRSGAKVAKRYHLPATPCDRLLASPHLSDATKRRLREERAGLDPVKLLKGIRDAQEDLAALSRPGVGAGSAVQRESLEQFLDGLPELWRKGEVRPTHRKEPKSPRTWRTRTDPFELVWPRVRSWLEIEPDATAKTLFDRLDDERPGEFAPGQLRTLQRRVREWRSVLARSLVGYCEDPEEFGSTREPRLSEPNVASRAIRERPHESKNGRG